MDRLGSNATRSGRTAIAIAFALLAPLAAQEEPDEEGWGGAFERAYESAASAAAIDPSALASRLALGIGAARLGSLDPEEAATQALAIAEEAERAMRFGDSPQAVRARLAQRAALESSGSAAAQRFLKERERDAARGKSDAAKAKKKPRPTKGQGTADGGSGGSSGGGSGHTGGPP